MKQYDKNSHTFVVCAYQESIFLEECIRSLLNQTLKTKICIATSTPNDYIQKIADQYEIPLKINQGEHGIAADWNFAVNCAETPLVTLAHQDDIYDKDYSRKIINTLNLSVHPLIAFSDYSEMRSDKVIEKNRLLTIKRILLTPLKFRKMWNSKIIRRRILAMGNAICCPSVTFVKENLNCPIFINNMKSNIDWQAWEELSKQDGEFVYIPIPLMKHRIHELSTTSELIEEKGRQEEDLFMFRKFWPDCVASLIGWFYRSSEKSNELK